MNDNCLSSCPVALMLTSLMRDLEGTLVAYGDKRDVKGLHDALLGCLAAVNQQWDEMNGVKAEFDELNPWQECMSLLLHELKMGFVRLNQNNLKAITA